MSHYYFSSLKTLDIHFMLKNFDPSIIIKVAFKYFSLKNHFHSFSSALPLGKEEHSRETRQSHAQRILKMFGTNINLDNV